MQFERSRPSSPLTGQAHPTPDRFAGLPDEHQRRRRSGGKAGFRQWRQLRRRPEVLDIRHAVDRTGPRGKLQFEVDVDVLLDQVATNERHIARFPDDGAMHVYCRVEYVISTDDPAAPDRLFVPFSSPEPVHTTA